MEEALGHGIIITISFATHTGDHAKGL